MDPTAAVEKRNNFDSCRRYNDSLVVQQVAWLKIHSETAKFV
jgi:hypothetical protein